MMSDSPVLLDHRILDLNRNSTLEFLFKKFVCVLKRVFMAKNEEETKMEILKD